MGGVCLVPAVFLLAVIAAPLPRPAWAQTARSLFQDSSVRSAGMGGASSAVAWSDDVNGWANPALLGYAHGIRYRWSHTRLLPEIAPDVTFQTDRVSYGWGGIGLAVESQALSYGQIELTDGRGIPIGSYEPTEHARPLSGGISLARTLEAMASLSGGSAPQLTRYADIAAGFSTKRVRLRLAPPGYGGEASADANDFGLLVRATPLPESDAGRPSLDVTYGFAGLNYDDARVGYIDESVADFVPRQYRHGFAARVGVPLSASASQNLERRFGRWFSAGLDPLLSVTVAADFAHFQLGPEEPYATDVRHVGVEFALANMVFARCGHVQNDFLGIDHMTFGVGFGLTYADFAGARYDYARDPQPNGLGMLKHHAIAAWFDPIAFVQR
jgi:hypothetical protein